MFKVNIKTTAGQDKSNKQEFYHSKQKHVKFKLDLVVAVQIRSRYTGRQKQGK